MELSRLLEPEILVLFIPIAAILVGGAVGITKLVLRHRERIAMIENGMDPDAPGRPGDGVFLDSRRREGGS